MGQQQRCYDGVAQFDFECILWQQASGPAKR